MKYLYLYQSYTIIAIRFYEKLNKKISYVNGTANNTNNIYIYIYIYIIYVVLF